MRELRDSIAAERPLIDAALMRHAESLPPQARRVAGHVLAAGGKRLRPLLTLLWGRMLGCKHDDLLTLGCAVEMLHAATLLHDDILDNAETRRGRAAAHTVFGITPVILAGDAMLARALLMVSGLGDTRLTSCISEAVMRTAEGEMAEFAALRDTSADHQTYLSVITGKTAWMLRAACELGALRAGAPDAVVNKAAAFGLELGIAFQMVDDSLDYAPEEETGKPSGGDLREGKITPPLLLYLESLGKQRAEIFLQGFATGLLSEEALELACREIFVGGHAQKARALADPHLERAAKALAEMPEEPERLVLEQMGVYVRSRAS